MSVPSRWRKCPRKGKLIADKFLPFKTPLSQEYDRELPEEYRFPPSMLMDYTSSIDRHMGLVIDLTKTDRYYDKRDVMKYGAGHHKIICEGYGSTPNEDQVKTFIKICNQFFEEHPGDIIGVHCTHGFNRTGFLIIAYLVVSECWDLEASVALFAHARPPGIYKEDYLHELVQRYAGGDTGNLVTPALPDWCFEEEEVNSGGEEEDKVGDKGDKKNHKLVRKKERNNEEATFAVQTSGVHLVKEPELRHEIQTSCQNILDWDSSGFPGSQPVSMDVQNIRLLSERPYQVSWKADGTRYILYIKDKRQIYLINRDNAVFSAPGISFFSRKNEGEYLRDCLADAELVIDNDRGVQRPRLLIYDVMQFEGSKDIAKCLYTVRLHCINKEFIQPREKAAENGMFDKTSEPFSVRAKQFWDVSEARMVLERFIPKLCHENDGLIFNPTDQEYKTGQCNEVLKWKPPELNTVDFRLKIVTTPKKEGMLQKKQAQLLVGSGLQVVIFSELDLRENKDAKDCNEKIIECAFRNGKWKFLRVRTDKSFPNSYETAKSVCQSIRQPVTKEWLLQVCEIYRWKDPHQEKGTKRSNKDDSSLMPSPKKPPPRGT